MSKICGRPVPSTGVRLACPSAVRFESVPKAVLPLPRFPMEKNGRGDETMPQVYVLLTDTGTLFSRSIRCWTRNPLNHASLALDPDLEEVYSFGRLHPDNPFIAGFVRERVWGSLIRRPERPTPCAIYRCRISCGAYLGLLEELDRFRLETPRWRYNLAGLLAVAAGIEWRRPDKYFCSQFVAHLFAAAGMPLVPKPPALTAPCDLEASPRLALVYRGDLREYCMKRGNVPKDVDFRRVSLPFPQAARQISLR